MDSRLTDIVLCLDIKNFISYDFEKLIINYPLISKIFLFNCESASIKEFRKSFIISQKEILSNDNCGCINKYSKILNISFYTEALTFNTCLNRKVAIDRFGFIKNCLSMTKVYGNIYEIDINTILDQSQFTYLWEINKDKILVCKDCEFRYCCLDCRAFLQNPDDNYSKPQKCNYDPYLGKYI
jgi:SPASM domain peptide maturase of grasp-with-spasm system